MSSGGAYGAGRADAGSARRVRGATAVNPPPFMGLYRVRMPLRGGGEIGPIDWEVHRRVRALVRVAEERQYVALRDVLCGTQEPIAGRVKEFERVVVQSDHHIRELINPGHSIRDALESSPLPDYVWLGQKRRALPVVMERLELLLAHAHLPLKHQPPQVLDRFWALRFLASQAHLLIGREIFALEDPAVEDMLRQRWDEFPGAVIYAGPEARLPGAINTVLEVDAAGAVTVAELTPLPEPEIAPPGAEG